MATATAWESLINAHTTFARDFVHLLAGSMDLEEALERYLSEMAITDPMATAVRNRVLVAIEATDRHSPGRAPLQVHRTAEPDQHEPVGWQRLRPDVIMRGVRERQRRTEATERWILLAIARAEEGVIRVHVDNALSFAALLERHLPLDRAVEEYIRSMGLRGGRAQAVFQHSMARLAEIHLPPLDAQPPSSRTGAPHRRSQS
jgi:hypothetical protein